MKSKLLLAVVFFGVVCLAAPIGSSLEQPVSSNTENYRYLNLRTNALYLLGGGVNLEVFFPVADQFTVGIAYLPRKLDRSSSVAVNGKTVNSSATTVRGFEVGVNTEFFLTGRRDEDGLILTPYLHYHSDTITEQKNSAPARSGKTSGIVLGTNFNYQFFWQNGINLAMGGGLSWTTDDEVEVSDGQSFPTRISVPHIFPGVRLDPQVNVSLGVAF